MQFTNILAVAVLLAGSALAAPAADANPPKAVKPSKPASTTVAQSNNCGNTATPYCCDSETLSALTTCSILAGGSQCSNTIVCCNSDKSVQLCLGNVNIL